MSLQGLTEFHDTNIVARFATYSREFAFASANAKAPGYAGVLSLNNVSPLMNQEMPKAHSASVSSA